ncbi:MAG: hypothetical protein FD163_1389 [Hyphomonadaceae bacterium]|nr:MAG: hypothetical protein FD128_1498 [Hyphomonadaceae bacterium]KAF0184692.1 MAG: hypothetical protein FD163_1389 [Hyphomonadaceae bacterium]
MKKAFTLSKRQILVGSVIGVCGLAIYKSLPNPIIDQIVWQVIDRTPKKPPPPRVPFFSDISEKAARLIDAAESQIGETLEYDAGYSKIAFPYGDISRRKGVCTDVIIRAFRDGLGIDLQALVYEDMKKDFEAYPKKWGLEAPDTNIDHRRVPNLLKFFERKGALVPISSNGRTYLPGDLVTAISPLKRPHIMLVSNRPNKNKSRPLVIHNIGAGTRIQDFLFEYELTGHIRFMT